MLNTLAGMPTTGFRVVIKIRCEWTRKAPIKGHSVGAFKVLSRLVAVGLEVAEGIGVDKAEKGVVEFKICPDLG